jgi:hypothetical protein
MSDMDVCEEIRLAHKGARCEIVDRRMSVIEAAKAFGLAEDASIYRAIEKEEADKIGTHILRVSLEVMSHSRAVDLWRGCRVLHKRWTQFQFVGSSDGCNVRHGSSCPGRRKVRLSLGGGRGLMLEFDLHSELDTKSFASCRHNSRGRRDARLPPAQCCIQSITIAAVIRARGRLAVFRRLPVSLPVELRECRCGHQRHQSKSGDESFHDLMLLFALARLHHGSGIPEVAQ